jgi:hypothetical protein
MTRAMVVPVMLRGRVLKVEFPTPSPTLWPWPTEAKNEASNGLRSDAVTLTGERLDRRLAEELAKVTALTGIFLACFHH